MFLASSYPYPTGSPEDNTRSPTPPPPSPGLSERPSLVNNFADSTSFHSGSPSSSPLPLGGQLDSPIPPASTYFAAPSSPSWEEPPSRLSSSPPTESNFDIQTSPGTIQDSRTDVDPPIDTFPASDATFDLSLDDEGLDPLGKIYLFSQSPAVHHRYDLILCLSNTTDPCWTEPI